MAALRESWKAVPWQRQAVSESWQLVEPMARSAAACYGLVSAKSKKMGSGLCLQHTG